MRNEVPRYLEAKTKDDLVRLMEAVNAKFSQNFHFFDFGYAQGKYYCWFEIKSTDLLKDRVNG